MCVAGAGALEWQALPALFPGLAQPGRWLPLLQRHAGLLAAAGERVRTTAVPAADGVRRHYAECLELLRIVTAEGPFARVADVGSGGGFPGLVFAAVLPEVEAHLVEPLQKRARLLAEMAEALDLGNVTVHALRAEEVGRGRLRSACDVVTARAVAPLAVLYEYTAPLAREGGLVALPKGSAAATEIAAAAEACSLLGLGPPWVVPFRSQVSEHIVAVLARRAGEAPERYPRRPGLPLKRPLGAAP